MRVSLTDLMSPDLARSAGIAGLGVDCGPYPAASGFGDSHVDANGATIRSPLTPAQNAQYLTAVATFQQCQGAQQGMPACPVGSHFSGGQDPVSGHWVGECVNTYTGLPSGGDSSGNGDSQNSSGNKSSDSSTESNSNTTLLLAAAAAAAFFLFKP